MPAPFERASRLLALLVLAGCQHGQEDGATAQDSMTTLPIVTLPTPRLTGPLALETTLARRRSVREFGADPLQDAEIGQLLWAAQGVTSPEGYRTAPSTGALYPLECYVATPAALYRYEPANHRLVPRFAGDQRPALAHAAAGQSAVADAAVVLVITAVYERTAAKYGEERAQRYAMLEAGHAAQNVLLQAAALGIGAVPIGAFHDDAVADLLRVPRGEEPLYLIAVGRPRR